MRKQPFSVMPQLNISTHALRLKANAVPLILALLFSFVYSLSFLNVYLQPHAYEQASRWVYDNVPSGSKLIGVHWDDRLPVGLPAYDPGRYLNSLELPLYEPDTPQKMRMVADTMSVGDYLIFPTQRIPGSLLRVPDEYPQTASFLRQLYAGQLGYQLVKTVRIEPAFWFWKTNDDLADESFSVYDHPKVAIFKNVEHWKSNKFIERIYAPPLEGTLPTLDQVLRSDSSAKTTPAFIPTTILQLISWVCVLEIVWFAALPLVAWLLPAAPDRGCGVSLTIGILALGYTSWLLASLGLAAPNAATLWAICAAFVLGAALLAYNTHGSWRAVRKLFDAHFLTAQCLFAGVVVVWIVMRALAPEVYWGEKPMDFTFLNFFRRNDVFPPQDPWAAGNTMMYYYFGSYLVAALARMCATPPGVAYNLGLITVAACMFLSAYSLCAWCSAQRVVVVLLSVAMIMLSNIEVLNLAFQGKALDFHLFWASTRLFTSPGITEYPLWSLLFADLHAHVISIPFCIALLAFGIALFHDTSTLLSPRFWILRALYGVLWGALFILNSWDFIGFALVSALIFGTKHFRQLSFGDALTPLTAIARCALDGVICAAFAAGSVAPFWLATLGRLDAGQGWNQSSEFSTLGQVLRHLVHWFVPLLTALIVRMIVSRHELRAQVRNVVWLVLSLAVVAYPIVVGALSRANGVYEQPWGIMTLCSFTLLLCCLCFNLAGVSRGERFGMICATAACIIIPFAEVRFLNDHMNTLFKFYNQVWILLAFGALAQLPFLCSLLRRDNVSTAMRWGVGAALGPTAALFLICALGSLLNIVIMTSHKHIEGPRPTLNGMAYLEAQDLDQARAIAWINKNVAGTPIILEAFGSSYQSFTRISMNTGLPTVLGWEYHVMQRGSDPREIERRRIDIRNIYSSPDPALAEELMRRYNVRLFVVGKLEHETYSAVGLKKFDEHPERFPLLYGSGDFKIYAAHYAFADFRTGEIS